jgi:hypothetical protein
MGIPTLISTATADDSSEVDITSGIDSTYDEYMFVCTDIHPRADGALFQFQVSEAGTSDLDEIMTTTSFRAYHAEDDSDRGLEYIAARDQAQGTAYQTLSSDTGSAADESTAGILHIFSPANTTYVTHFYSRFFSNTSYVMAMDWFTSGYINIPEAIDEISFKMHSGNFDGTIQMYGIS